MTEKQKPPKTTTPKASTGDAPESKEERARWRPTRRQFIGLGAAGAAGLLLAGRACFYDNPSTPAWSPAVLAHWEVAVLAASAGALLPDTPAQLTKASASGPSGVEVAQMVDGFLRGCPGPMILEIHAMFGLIEHGTILNGSILRFTRLAPEKRLDYLLRLNQMGSKFGEAFRGLRELCLLGWYAHPKTWVALDYDGPLLERPAPKPVQTAQSAGKYDRLLAPAGAHPKGTL